MEELVIEHACGHIRKQTVWKELGKQLSQVKRLEALFCPECQKHTGLLGTAAQPGHKRK